MPEALRLPGYANNYISYMSTAMATKTIAGIDVPDSPLITAALELARKHSFQRGTTSNSAPLPSNMVRRQTGLLNASRRQAASIVATTYRFGWAEVAMQLVELTT